MKTVIMAGGRGTRISSVNATVPKPMIMICGKPVLQWQIECFSRQGITDFILTVGYKREIIQDYFGDGSGFGVSIQYIVEEIPLGTAGALFYLKKCVSEDFVLINGDLIFDIDVVRFYQFHLQHKGLATILTHPNSHPYDSGIIETDPSGRIMKWLHKEDERTWYKNQVNSGIHILSTQLLQTIDEPRKMDLDRDLLQPLVGHGLLFAYSSPEYIMDMGTPDRFLQVEKDICNGVVSAKNLRKKQKAVFLDRDGTINAYVGFLCDIEQFELLPDAAKSIRRIHDMGYLAIVVTNQPVIARGELTDEQLNQIHHKMETLLGLEGAYLDAIYYCPHHPDRGYPGEIPDLKIECCCRKPKPGMLLQASKDLNIDLSSSWMIGDKMTDVLAGKAASCQSILLGKTSDNIPQAQTLYDAVSIIDGANQLHY